MAVDAGTPERALSTASPDSEMATSAAETSNQGERESRPPGAGGPHDEPAVDDDTDVEPSATAPTSPLPPLLDDVGAGGASLVIHGDPGIGKSTAVTTWEGRRWEACRSRFAGWVR
jgi:predicted ATP-dependent serine protease